MRDEGMWCPTCGKHKAYNSTLCGKCRMDVRRSKPDKKIPDANSLSYFGDSRASHRYGLIAVSGYNVNANHTVQVTFCIVDSHDMWREVSWETVRLNRAAQKRDELVMRVKTMNVAERAIDRRERAVTNGH